MTSLSKHYLRVPYQEKDYVKSLGAKWDNQKRLWYYTGQEMEKFKKWRIEESLLNFYDLSHEQQSMIELAKSGYNILVDACIGSGKTTAIQVMCNELLNKKILYLTYNKLLKIDAKKKIRSSHVTVTNYHGFAYSCLHEIDIDAGISDLIQAFLHFKNKINIPHYDVLVIDEYQDIEEEIANMLECIKKANPSIQIIVVGDMEQKIYDKTRLEVQKFITSFLGQYKKLYFTKCFRLCDDLTQKLSIIWNKKIHGVNSKCKLSYMDINEAIHFISEQNTSDILCLGSRNGDMSKVLNRLEEICPEKFNKKTLYASIRDNDSNGVQIEENAAIFTTFDSCKGMERKVCVIFDFTEDYWNLRLNQPNANYETIRNIFCVALSRGKEHIIIIRNPKEKILNHKVLATPTKYNIQAGLYNISDMFDFKYKEDIEECFYLISRKPISSNNQVIDIPNSDYMIDLSPCIGIYQEASFFKKYDIDEQIEFTMRFNKNRPPINIQGYETLEQKILFLTAYETYQDRYVKQVKQPFINEQQLKLIHNRLYTLFNGNEMVQTECQMRFFDDRKNHYDISGKADVLLNNVVYELKFVNELKHEHFLQCACYIVALNLDKGILWNIRNNEKYVITIPDRHKFINAVIKTITKGIIKDCKYLIF